MKQLIVNADDFGLTKRVSEAIVDVHRHGIVTSTTLMANGAAFEGAVALSRQMPRLGIGAHLNLSEGLARSRGIIAAISSFLLPPFPSASSSLIFSFSLPHPMR